MKTVEIKKRDLDYREYVKRSAREEDYDTLITGDTLVLENGEPKILYKKLDTELTKYVRQATKNIKYQTGTRTGGLKSTSRIFGYNPRNTIRKDFCSVTSLAVDYPTEHKIICDFGAELADMYAEYFPNVYKRHEEVTNSRMLDEWILKDTPFTSGIINKNNPLKYHFDAGNIKNVLSNMVVFKNGIQGGYLACPEYNVGFEVADNTVILFDGQNILHGVTKITQAHPKGYRYSIVYYTLQQIWNCLPMSEELARVRNVRHKREVSRAQNQPQE